MAFTLPSDLSTSWVDGSSTITASDWNNTASMGNAIKAAIATWGYGIKTATVATSEATTSASYTDLATTTDSVTVAIGSSGKALIAIAADITVSSVSGYLSYDVSGATTSAAADAKSFRYMAAGTNSVHHMDAMFLETSLTPGFNTFKLKYRVSSGTGTFINRRITVIPFPATDGTHASGSFSLAPSLSVGMSGAGLNRPTYDTTGAGYATATTVTTGSLSHTGATGATPILAVGLGCSTADCVLSATYGGAPMVEIGRVWAASTGSTGTVLFGLLGACTGSAATVTFTSSKNLDQGLTMQCISYTNVNSFGQAIYAAGGANNPTITTTAILPGSLAVNATQVQNSTGVAGYSQTSRYADAKGSYDAFVFGEAPIPGISNVSITFGATTANNWGTVIVPLNPQTNPMPGDKTSSTVVVGPITTTTYSHTGTSGTTPIVMVATDSGTASFSTTTASVTYNGAAMTQIAWVPTYSTYNMGVGLFVKQGACTGSACNVVVTVSPSMQGLESTCTSYYNVTSVTAPIVQDAGTAQPSITIPSAAGQRVVAAWRNHYSGAKGFSKVAGVTRFNDNSYKVSSANPGTMLVCDTPALSGSTTLSAYTALSYGLGGIGTALTTAAPTTVDFDAVGGGIGSANGNWNHTIAGNALLVFGTMWYNAGFTFGWTINGQAYTPNMISKMYFNNTYYFGQTWCWVLANPPTGVVNIAISVTSGAGPIGCSMNSISYSNVGKIGDPVSVAATSATVTMTAAGIIPSGRIVNAFGGDGANTFTAYSQTQRYNQPYANPARQLVIGDAAGNTSGVTFTTTVSPAVDYAGFVVPLLPTYFI